MDGGYAVLGATVLGHAHVYGFNVPPCIPTVSAWGLLVMLLILLIAGSLVARRAGRKVS